MSGLSHLAKRFGPEGFLAHPAAVGETYFQHLAAAWGFSARLLRVSAKCFVHGLFPPAFEHAASDAVRELYIDLTARRVLADGAGKA